MKSWGDVCEGGGVGIGGMSVSSGFVCSEHAFTRGLGVWTVHLQVVRYLTIGQKERSTARITRNNRRRA